MLSVPLLLQVLLCVLLSLSCLSDPLSVSKVEQQEEKLANVTIPLQIDPRNIQAAAEILNLNVSSFDIVSALIVARNIQMSQQSSVNDSVLTSEKDASLESADESVKLEEEEPSINGTTDNVMEAATAAANAVQCPVQCDTPGCVRSSAPTPLCCSALSRLRPAVLLARRVIDRVRRWTVRLVPAPLREALRRRLSPLALVGARVAMATLQLTLLPLLSVAARAMQVAGFVLQQLVQVMEWYSVVVA